MVAARNHIGIRRETSRWVVCSFELCGLNNGCIEFREFLEKSRYSERRKFYSSFIDFERNFIVLSNIPPTLSHSVSQSASQPALLSRIRVIIIITHSACYYGSPFSSSSFLICCFHSSAIIRQMKWRENIKIGKILPFFTSREIVFVYSFKKKKWNIDFPGKHIRKEWKLICQK